MLSVFIALSLFLSRDVFAEENLVIEKYKCVDGLSFDIVEIYDGKKKRYNGNAINYLFDLEFDKYVSELSDNLQDNIKDKNEAVVRLYFQAAMYFFTANIERLKQVKGALGPVILMSDELSLVNNLDYVEQSLFYEENEIWYKRYGIAARVDYWLWYLTREQQFIDSMNKSRLLLKDTFSFLPEYMTNTFMGGRGDDIPPIFYLSEFDSSLDDDISYANFISEKNEKFDEDSYKNIQKIDREYWNINEENQYFNYRMGLPDKQPKYPSSKPNTLQLKKAFAEGMEMLLENGQGILRNGQLRTAHGLSADKEIDFLIKHTSALSESCMAEVLNIYNAIITILAVQNANVMKQQDRICEYKNIAKTSRENISESYSSVYVSEALSTKYNERVKNLECDKD